MNIEYAYLESFNLDFKKYLEVVKAFEKASGVTIPYVIEPRRPGDIATCYSNPQKAEKELGWKAQKGIDEMCADSYRWQSQNPNGYEDWLKNEFCSF